jgi:nicotinate-nucleotide adenylyltransferase
VGLSGTAPWGVLGGTFDPIHLAHLAIAAQACEELGLAGVLVMPAGEPPHKRERDITAAEHRVAMVERAIVDHADLRLSRLEVDRPGPSYTVDTAERLVAGEEPALAGHDIVWIVSDEALLALPTWHRPERLLELVRLATVPRLGYERPGVEWVRRNFPGREDRVAFLTGPHLGHSATEIRARARAGLSIAHLVPAAVERYIHDHGLYRADPAPARDLAPYRPVPARRLTST